MQKMTGRQSKDIRTLEKCLQIEIEMLGYENVTMWQYNDMTTKYEKEKIWNKKEGNV